MRTLQLQFETLYMPPRAADYPACKFFQGGDFGASA